MITKLNLTLNNPGICVDECKRLVENLDTGFEALIGGFLCDETHL